jgi:hypothetical protein
MIFDRIRKSRRQGCCAGRLRGNSLIGPTIGLTPRIRQERLDNSPLLSFLRQLVDKLPDRDVKNPQAKGAKHNNTVVIPARSGPPRRNIGESATDKTPITR